jgi:hypothetical protein
MVVDPTPTISARGAPGEEHVADVSLVGVCHNLIRMWLQA